MIAGDGEMQGSVSGGCVEGAVVMEAIEAGAADFIVKPFKPERLLSAINKALQG